MVKNKTQIMNELEGKEVILAGLVTVAIGNLISYLAEGAILAGIGYVIGGLTGLLVIELLRRRKMKNGTTRKLNRSGLRKKEVVR